MSEMRMLRMVKLKNNLTGKINLKKPTNKKQGSAWISHVY